MKFQVVLFAVLFCLAAEAAGTRGQSAPTPPKAARVVERTLTGCIDEQDGHYVLLDDMMLRLADLQSAGTDREVFAKYLGRMVHVKGTSSSGQRPIFRVSSIEEAAGKCGGAK